MSAGHRLEAVHLTKVFQGRKVLDDVSFSFEGARTIGYLGPNGAGKTTTLKLLCGLLRPSEGAALIDGIDVRDDPRSALERTGSVIETPEPYPELTVREAIRMAGRFRGLSNESIAEQIAVHDKALELPPLDARCGKLSKGQRQRAVLAAALISDPPVLLLDEPTSGLDPAERIRVRNVILARKGRSLILMSSHLLNEVTETCDEVVFLNNGRIVRQGSVAEVTDAIAVKEVEVEFSEAVDPRQMEPLRGLCDQALRLGARRFRLGFDGRVESRIRILELCLKIAPVIEYSPSGSALEGAYLQVMGESVAPTSGVPPPPPPPPG